MDERPRGYLLPIPKQDRIDHEPKTHPSKQEYWFCEIAVHPELIKGIKVSLITFISVYNESLPV